MTEKTYPYTANEMWTVLCAPTSPKWQDDLMGVVDGKEDLLSMQQRHHEEGFRVAEIVQGVAGWYLRTKHMGGEKVSPWFTDKNLAINFACKVWYREDPTKREVIIRFDRL